MKPRWAVYVKLRGSWRCLTLKKNREDAWNAYSGLGTREKKLERLEVTYVWTKDKVGKP